MGKSILTPKQLKFLEFISLEPQITKRFYLTGGTALAEFHLQHRLSEDIDLFTEEKEVYHPTIDAFLTKNLSKLKAKRFDRTQFLGLVSYHLIYNDGDKLKVDFNYYPFPRIEKGLKFKNLNIDSLLDIATNKVHTIFIKPRTRDYIDLYFMFKKEKLDLDKLILFAKAKFDWHIDRVNLAAQFARIKDIKVEDYPKVLAPFSVKEMEDFFLGLAKDLEKDIFK